VFVVYYESIKREIQRRHAYECRYDERLKTKVEHILNVVWSRKGTRGCGKCTGTESGKRWKFDVLQVTKFIQEFFFTSKASKLQWIM
jgi:hypothetical protein